MKHTSLHRLLIVVALAIVTSCVLSLAWAYDWDQRARERKAAYIFMESQAAVVDEALDDYAILSERAYRLDSTDLDIASQWALIELSIDASDSATADRAYKTIKKQFLFDPTYSSGIIIDNLVKRLGKYEDVAMVWEKLDSAYPSLSTPSEQLANAYVVCGILGDSLAYGKAMKIYERLEAGSGKNVGLSSQKIRAFLAQSDTASVLAEIESLVQSAPADPVVAAFAGSNYQYLDEKERALEYFNKACELDSTYGPAYLARANIYMQMGDSVGYDRETFNALISQNIEPEMKVSMLKEYVIKLWQVPAQRERIEQLFNTLVQQHSGEPEIYNLYAAYLMQLERYSEAAEQMTYSVALDPNNDKSWQTLIGAYSLARDYDAAISVGRKAMDRFKTNLYYPIAISTVYRERNLNDSAIAVLESVEIGEVENPNAVSNFLTVKADIYASAKDTVKALKVYDEAIELYPDNVMAMNNAAYFMAQTDQDLDKAERYSAKVMRLEPDNPTYIDTYAWIFFKKKQYSLARQYIDITLNFYNNTDSVDEDIVYVDEVPKEGEEGYEEGLYQEPEGNDIGVDENGVSGEIYEHAGDIYFMDGEPQKAVEFWEKALPLYPNNELLKKKVKYKTYFYK